MDFQDAPILKISEKERRKNENYLTEIVQRSDDSVKKTAVSMKKAGYTDQEIDMFFDA